MARGFDELIDFLLSEIALCGDQGARIADFRSFVQEFYKDEPSTLDDAFLERVWQWMTAHPDIWISHNGQKQVLTLLEAEAADGVAERARAARLASPSETVADSNSTTLLIAADSDGEQSDFDQSGEALREAEGPGASRGKSNSSKPNGSTKAKSGDTDYKDIGVRINASEDRVWLGLTYHGVDSAKVPVKDFELLSIIARQKEKGILQPDLVRLSGQDKRSVPKRTDRLSELGYISKEAKVAPGMRTSLLIHKRFKKEEPDHSPDSIFENGGMVLWKFFDFLFDFLKKQQVVGSEDLRKILGIHLKRLETRQLWRALKRLYKLGLIAFVKAKFEVDGSVLAYNVNSIKLLRLPNDGDRINFQTYGWEKEADAAEEDLVEGEGDLDVPDIDPKLEDAQRKDRTMPQWSIAVPLNNFLFNLVDSSGKDGLTSVEVAKQGIGTTWSRALDQTMDRLSDDWEKSQPAHLRHLSIVRDTKPHESRGYIYVYRSFRNHQQAVDEGQAVWEAVCKSRPELLPTSRLDFWGFPQVANREFVGSGVSPSLQGCLKALDPKLSKPTASDPFIRVLPNGTETIDWPVQGHGERDAEEDGEFATSKSKLKVGAGRRSGGGLFPGVTDPSEYGRLWREMKKQEQLDAAWQSRARKLARWRVAKELSREPGTVSTGKKRNASTANLDSIPMERVSQRKRTRSRKARETSPEQAPEQHATENIESSRQPEPTTCPPAQEVPPNEAPNMIESLGDGSSMDVDNVNQDYERRQTERSNAEKISKDRIANVLQDILSLNGPGAYYEPPKARRPLGERPRQSGVLLIKSNRLRELDWFCTESDTNTQEVAVNGDISGESSLVGVDEGGTLEKRLEGASPLEGNLSTLRKPSEGPAQINHSAEWTEAPSRSSPLLPKTGNDELSQSALGEVGESSITISNDPHSGSLLAGTESTTLAAASLAKLAPDETVKNTKKGRGKRAKPQSQKTAEEAATAQDMGKTQPLRRLQRKRKLSTKAQALLDQAHKQRSNEDLSVAERAQDAGASSSSRGFTNDFNGGAVEAIEVDDVREALSSDPIMSDRDEGETAMDVDNITPPHTTAGLPQVNDVLRCVAESCNGDTGRSVSQPSNEHDVVSARTVGAERGQEGIAVVQSSGEVPYTDLAQEPGSASEQDAAHEPIQTPHTPSKSRFRRGLTVRGGSVAHVRSNIILEMVGRCNGAIPGDTELLQPFSAAYRAKLKDVPVPDRRTVQKVLKALLDTARLKQFTFAFRAPTGRTLTKRIVAAPHLTPTSDEVLTLQKQITSDFPKLVIPDQMWEPGLKPDDSLQLLAPRQYESRDLYAPDASATVQLLKPTEGQVRTAKRLANRRERRIAREARRTKKVERAAARAARAAEKAQRVNMQNAAREANLLKKKSQVLNRPAANKKGLQNDTRPVAPPSGGTAAANRPVLSPEQAMAAQWTSASAAFNSTVMGAGASYPAQSLSWIFYRGPTQQQDKPAKARFAGSDKILLAPEQSFNRATGTFSTDLIITREPTSRTSRRLPPAQQPSGPGIAPAPAWRATKPAPAIAPAQALEPRPEAVASIPPVQTLAPAKAFEPRPEAVASVLPAQPLTADTTGSQVVPVSGAPRIIRRRRSKRTRELENGIDDSVLAMPRKRAKTTAAKPMPVEHRMTPVQNVSDMTANQILKLTHAMTAARVLASGIDGAVNWSIIDHVFRNDPSYDNRMFKLKWSTIQKHRTFISQTMVEDFQNRFLDAYEAGEVPAINYARPEETDWDGILDWSLRNVPAGTGNLPILPPDKETFNEVYRIDEAKSLYGQSRGKVQKATITEGQRSDFHHDFSLQLLHPSQQDAFAALSLQSANTDPSTPSEPVALSIAGAEDAGSGATGAMSALMIAKSVVRSQVLTSASAYEAKSAQERLDTIPADVLQEAVYELNNQRIISKSKKETSKDRPAGPLRTYAATEYFENALPGNRKLSLLDFRAAALFKAELDSVFRSGQTSVTFTMSMSDGANLATTNLMASDRVEVAPQLPPFDSTIGAPLPRITAWGWNEGKYKGSKTDQRSMEMISLEIEPSSSYQYGHPLAVLATQEGREFPPAVPRPESKDHAVPVWVDMHGNIIWDLWQKVLCYTVQTVHLRPYIGVEELTESFRNLIWGWEIQMVLDWAVKAGFVTSKDDVAPSGRVIRSGWRTTEWWWLCLASKEELNNPEGETSDDIAASDVS